MSEERRRAKDRRIGERREGRPSLFDDGEETSVISFRVSAKDHDALLALARLRRMDLGELIRDLLQLARRRSITVARSLAIH